MSILRRISFHPLLFAAYPVLALYSANVTQIEFSSIFRCLIVLIGIAAFLQLILRVLGIAWRRAGGIVSITFILFFSFGDVFVEIPRTTALGILFGQMRVLLAVWIAIWILSTWFLIRVMKSQAGITLFLNTVSAGLLILTVVPLSIGLLKEKPPAPLQLPVPQAAATQAKPDIYYIILDSYPRADILQEDFSYDNSEFIQFLKTRGFYIADQSYSNFGQTATSLASSLNFEYVQNLNDLNSSEIESRNYLPLHQLITQSRVRDFLEEQGYRFVTFESGYGITNILDSDDYISFGLPLNNFESLLLDNSLAVIFIDRDFNSAYRNRITGTLDQLTDLSAIPSPKFVFAHIMAAHPPFVFGPNGEVIDAKSSRIVRETDKTGVEGLQVYTGQVTYINHLLEQTIDGILKNSRTEPIILIQADHGTALNMDWKSLTDVCYHERLAILNAYHLPGQRTEKLYPQISPVNSFRVVFDTYFGTEMGLLKDEHYYSTWLLPYKFIQVNNQVEATCSQKASAGKGESGVNGVNQQAR